MPCQGFGHWPPVETQAPRLLAGDDHVALGGPVEGGGAALTGRKRGAGLAGGKRGAGLAGGKRGAGLAGGKRDGRPSRVANAAAHEPCCAPAVEGCERGPFTVACLGFAEPAAGQGVPEIDGAGCSGGAKAGRVHGPVHRGKGCGGGG
eukprot:scaffold25101_cov67-Isochrysis_galbana.AAC.1